jgi:hypothetical protein
MIMVTSPDRGSHVTPGHLQGSMFQSQGQEKKETEHRERSTERSEETSPVATAASKRNESGSNILIAFFFFFTSPPVVTGQRPTFSLLGPHEIQQL